MPLSSNRPLELPSQRLVRETNSAVAPPKLADLSLLLFRLAVNERTPAGTVSAPPWLVLDPADVFCLQEEESGVFPALRGINVLWSLLWLEEFGVGFVTSWRHQNLILMQLKYVTFQIELHISANQAPLQKKIAKLRGALRVFREVEEQERGDETGDEKDSDDEDDD